MKNYDPWTKKKISDEIPDSDYSDVSMMTYSSYVYMT